MLVFTDSRDSEVDILGGPITQPVIQGNWAERLRSQALKLLLGAWTQRHHVPAVWLWASCYSSLMLSCLVYKMGTVPERKVKVFAAHSCPTLCDSMDCSPPDSSVHGIFQAKILKWVSISSSRGASQPRDWTPVSKSPVSQMDSLPLSCRGSCTYRVYLPKKYMFKNKQMQLLRRIINLQIHYLTRCGN